LGVAYSAIEGHRGLMHSFVFALMLALVAGALASSLRTTRRRAFGFVLISGASHGLLDMLTTGGLGVAYFWPLSDARLFFPWHMIEVSPLSTHRLLSPRGRVVMESEWHTVWLPAIAMCMALWAARRVFSKKGAESHHG
jgi:inner membrane protein